MHIVEAFFYAESEAFRVNDGKAEKERSNDEGGETGLIHHYLEKNGCFGGEFF